MLQQDYPEVVDLGVAASGVVELDDTRSEVVDLGVGEFGGVVLGVAVSEVDLGVAVSEVLKLGDAEPEVVKLGVTVSAVVGLAYAEPEVVELGVAVSEVLTQDEVELGYDGVARFVYTSSSSSSERVDVESAATRSPQQASLG